MMRNLELLLFLCYCSSLASYVAIDMRVLHASTATCTRVIHDHEPDDSIIRAYSMTATFVDTGYE